ncbi:hypothetical protein [Halanaerobacter jeridensis]|uniref:Uncharacterized protein n=1 Tax=Halanaerobacter jeridensis TaxID=706427 RepID=A0A938XR31_9FIRM|nr:hypothetical protein [Halanaerobacter jeridensis]MBM7556066.1 hypothetical protein [Halanaerobacter jeridensis]
MKGKILTINRYLEVESLDSIDILNQLRCYVREAKQLNPQLENYQLYDIGFIPHQGFVLVKIYFYTV